MGRSLDAFIVWGVPANDDYGVALDGYDEDWYLEKFGWADPHPDIWTPNGGYSSTYTEEKYKEQYRSRTEFLKGMPFEYIYVGWGDDEMGKVLVPCNPKENGFLIWEYKEGWPTAFNPETLGDIYHSRAAIDFIDFINTHTDLDGTTAGWYVCGRFW